MTTPQRSRAGIVGRSFAGAIAGIAGVAFLFMGWLAVSSRFGPPVGDPHGYGLIIGGFLATLAGFVTAAVLPLAFPRRRWALAYAISLTSFVVVLVLLIALVVTT